MRYVSTRGAAPVLGFADTLLAGLATDGGLYVPEGWPELAMVAARPELAMVAARPELAMVAARPQLAMDGGSPSTAYADTAVEVMWPFVEGSIEQSDFAAIVREAYSTFSHPDVTPLVELGDGIWLLELFHGPTLAFKDVALQLVGRLFDHELARRSSRVTIVGATSGDTGSAAIEACRDRKAIDIVILHPNGRVSEVQRRQMTTVLAPNVFNVAIDGTFDDCQDLVKAMFNDESFRVEQQLSAVNSINWARVMAQIVYYVVAADRLGGRGEPISFSVPTGNFGNVFAGHGAKQMGLDIRRFVVGSNPNDILTQFFTTGEMTIGDVHHRCRRAWTSRCRRTSSGSCSSSTSATVRRSSSSWTPSAATATSPSARRDSPSWRRRGPACASTTSGPPRSWPTPTNEPGCCSTRTPRSVSARPTPPDATPTSPWSRWPRRIPRSSPMPSSRPRAYGRRFPRTSRSCSAGPSSSSSCPTICPRSSSTCEP
jgi:threonine synthase